MCICIFFFHFYCCSCLYSDDDCMYRYASFCRCRSLSSFLRFSFYFFLIQMTLTMLSALCCLFRALRFSPFYSVTIHFTFVRLCLSYSKHSSCPVSMRTICIFSKQYIKRVSHHIIPTWIKEILNFSIWH